MALQAVAALEVVAAAVDAKAVAPPPDVKAFAPERLRCGVSHEHGIALLRMLPFVEVLRSGC